MSMLFFHFDGTDNSPNDACAPEHSISSITNVLKSHLLLGGRVKNQIDITPTCLPYRSFYYAGIGTYGSWLEQKINAALARRFPALITPLINRPIIIEAVIDTVASIGWPNSNITQRPTTEVVFEHGNTLSEGVHRALHLVALDEQRLAFRPTLINLDGRALEIWLAGVHSDIGGGYRKDGIGDIALRVLINWIEQQTKQNCYHATHLAKTQPPHWQPLLTIEPKHLGKIHYQQRRLHPWRKLTLAPRQCCVLENDQPNHTLSPHWHQSVTQRIHSNIGYFPIAHCPTPAILWHHEHPTQNQPSRRSDETRHEA
ncbi:T6SS phospholipase effector Tle1-like catalytic domain-containing protein [Marinomonas sp.]|uniref:T6SS phospholipase effector Tle1-like catalytic domain-containing protein n=1 Tax=Marinomonas sp. TaxID=1904862 RepID=UPI003A95DB04